MSNENKSGIQLKASPEEYSPFEEFKINNATYNFRLGFIPSFSQDFSLLNNNPLNVVFFRVCNPQSDSPFLSFLVYKNCSDSLEFPFSSDIGGQLQQDKCIKNLLYYVSTKAGIRFYSKIGLVGQEQSQYILCEVLDCNIPFDENLKNSFMWLTTTELVQDEVMGFELSDNIRNFVQSATGACRLFKNETIVPGARTAFLCCKKSDLKRFEIDYNYSFKLQDIVFLTEYKLAEINSFFSSMPTKSGSQIHNYKFRDKAYIFRVIIPNEVSITPCLLDTGFSEPLRVLTADVNINSLYIISRHKLELFEDISTIHEFLKSKRKPIFLS